MKYIKKFESIIKPISLDGLIDELVDNVPNTLESANVISQEYEIDILDLPTFIESVRSNIEFSKTIPNQYIFTPSSGLYFGILNPVTSRINIVVNYVDFKSFLTNVSDNPKMGIFRKIMKSMLSHETIHKQQLDRISGDYSKYDLKGSPEFDTHKYLSSSTEIMAYAFSIVDELKRSGESKESILDILRKFKGHWVIQWYISEVKDKKVLNKLRKYAYLYVEELF